MTVRLSGLARFRVGEVIHIRPAYAPSACAVQVTLKFRDYSVRWSEMQPEEPPVIVPLADWLVLAGVAAMVALSALA
jgi:hypothetical protein